MKVTDIETWKDVENYEGLYQVSTCGKVKSLKRLDSVGRRINEKILKPAIRSDGYLVVVLYRAGDGKQFPVHRLVAIAFIPNPKNLPEVNHKDEDKCNPHVKNLEWMSHRANSNYGTARLRSVANTDWERRTANINWAKTVLKHDYVAIGKKNGKPIRQFSKHDELIMEFDGARQASRKLNIAHQSITACCKGRKRSAGGFIWRYREESQL